MTSFPDEIAVEPHLIHDAASAGASMQDRNPLVMDNTTHLKWRDGGEIIPCSRDATLPSVPFERRRCACALLAT